MKFQHVCSRTETAIRVCKNLQQNESSAVCVKAYPVPANSERRPDSQEAEPRALQIRSNTESAHKTFSPLDKASSLDIFVIPSQSAHARLETDALHALSALGMLASDIPVAASDASLILLPRLQYLCHADDLTTNVAVSTSIVVHKGELQQHTC